MSALAWLLRLLFFLAMLWFALKNTTPVTVRLTETLQWDGVPLVVVILAALLVGMLLAAAALAPAILRARRAAPRETPVARPPARSESDDDAEARADRLAQAARSYGAASGFDATQTRRR
jgi:uncharacterized integral membrane protein